MEASKKRKLPRLLAASQAGYYCRPDMVRALLEAGEDVHVRDKDGSTALHVLLANRDPMCVNYEHEEECLSLLLQAGADPNAADGEGQTSLHLFGGGNAQVGYVTLSMPVLRRLLAAGANPNAVDAQGETPLHVLACWDSAAEVGKDDWGPEAERNSPSLVPMLLEAGAVVDIVSRSGKTPLTIAVEEECGAMAKLLRSHGASTTLLSDALALFVAAMEDDVEAATRFLDTGVDPGVRIGRYNCDRTVLHDAAVYDAAGVTRLLLQRGADPNAVRGSMSKETPTILAIKANRVEALQAILEHISGLDLEALEYHCERAAEAGHWEVAYALVLAGVPLNLCSAALLDDTSALREIIDSTCRKKNDWQKLKEPLELAAGKGNLASVHVLLGAYQQKEVAPRDKLFPLSAASRAAQQNGHTELSAFLENEWQCAFSLSL